jgi:hypothetical protein
MQFHTAPFQLYEPGKTNHKIVHNVSWLSIISIVTRLQVVTPSGLGSIHSNGIQYKYTIQIVYEALKTYNSMGKVKLKLMVKFTLQQATKAQTESRGIGLMFL